MQAASSGQDQLNLISPFNNGGALLPIDEEDEEENGQSSDEIKTESTFMKDEENAGGGGGQLVMPQINSNLQNQYAAYQNDQLQLKYGSNSSETRRKRSKTAFNNNSKSEILLSSQSQEHLDEGENFKKLEALYRIYCYNQQ
ncbi:hypothetical protein FGO68_gene1261 [Halteria grandinella]|uniref:Uncharacterized protein n=1 Tax=Halteria grandinella TaxID=5974 RepID=A0A8J8T6G7_HALGN|nr:hypothetical protein FGO68_gene1261 [Halteria grandinella]